MPMRIAFYAPLKPPDHPAPSGDRRMARLLMAALGGAGYGVELASRFRSYDGTGDAPRQDRLKAIGGKLAERLIRRYRRRPREQRPAAWFTYHLYHKAPDWLGPAISQALGIPYLVAEASFAPKQAGGPWAVGHAAAAALPLADAVFAPNPADEGCVVPLLATRERFVDLPPFLDTEPYFAAAAERDKHRAALAAELDLDPETPWILAVAMMRPGDKLASYRVLGGALEYLRGLPWRLLVAGGGAAETEVRNALEASTDRAVFLGECDGDELRRYYAACDLLAWPSVNEAYGMALLEAQAAGLPVVAARVGGVDGIVADGGTGLLAVRPEAPEFADALATVLDNTALRREMSVRALEKVAERHTVTAAAARLKAVIDPLLGERRS